MNHLGQRFLPTRLSNPGDHSLVGEIAEADSTHLELPINGPRPPAQLAPPHAPGHELRLRIRFVHPRLSGHQFICSSDLRNGIPKPINNAFASASLFALVTNVMCIPWLYVILARSISEKIDWSGTPIV